MTNAIRFTNMQAGHKIVVALGASVELPPYEKCVEIEWFLTRAAKPNRDAAMGVEWGGTGQPVSI